MSKLLCPKCNQEFKFPSVLKTHLSSSSRCKIDNVDEVLKNILVNKKKEDKKKEDNKTKIKEKKKKNKKIKSDRNWYILKLSKKFYFFSILSA
jgi:Zn-finger nucleic acid-binding protein